MVAFLRLFIAGFFLSLYTLMLATPASASGALSSGWRIDLDGYARAGSEAAIPHFGARDDAPAARGRRYRLVLVRRPLVVETCVRPKPPRVGVIMVPPPEFKKIKGRKMWIIYIDCSREGYGLRKLQRKFLKKPFAGRVKIYHIRFGL